MEHTQQTIERLETDFTGIFGPELKRAGAIGVLIGTIEDTADRLYGVWNDSLCFTFRDQFNADRWCGPGPCIGLNLEQISRDADDLEGALAAVAAHEFAHCLDRFADGGELFAQSAPRAVEAASDTLQAFLSDPTPSPPHVEVVEHGPQFIRLALHVAHRLTLSGWRTPLRWLFESQVAGEWAYLTALQDELVAMENCPITDVVKLPAPAAFLEAWEADRAAILSQHESQA